MFCVIVATYFVKRSRVLLLDDIPSLRSLQAEQINLHNLITELSVKLHKLYTQNSSLKDQVDKTYQS